MLGKRTHDLGHRLGCRHFGGVVLIGIGASLWHKASSASCNMLVSSAICQARSASHAAFHAASLFHIYCGPCGGPCGSPCGGPGIPSAARAAARVAAHGSPCGCPWRARSVRAASGRRRPTACRRFCRQESCLALIAPNCSAGRLRRRALSFRSAHLRTNSCRIGAGIKSSRSTSHRRSAAGTRVSARISRAVALPPRRSAYLFSRRRPAGVSSQQGRMAITWSPGYCVHFAASFGFSQRANSITHTHGFACQP